MSLCLRERLEPQASGLEGDLYDTPMIEEVEAMWRVARGLVRHLTLFHFKAT